MPQLTPDPWFFILTCSWLIMLTFAPLKIFKHYTNNNPQTKSTKILNNTWNWPWT
uniref:ATP synthase complex subunit 8 n=1 Tax=Anilany helenae TaxID=508491 RepID=A0A8K1N093_9NEOB|nr:ATP synthase F0 subunit 8 [Anilany helenae]